MKYKVIGWTYYEDPEIPHVNAGYADHRAIIEEIKEKGYCFSGYAHQEYLRCVPVINDGKKRLYSQRGWGGLMATAQGYNGPMDYSFFAIGFRTREAEKTPPLSESIGNHVDEITAEDLSEEFSVEVTKAQLDGALGNGRIIIFETPELYYLDKGDRLLLSPKEERTENAAESAVHRFTVTDMKRGWDKNDGAGEIEPIKMDDMAFILHCGDPEEKKLYEQIYRSGKRILALELEPCEASSAQA